MAGHSIPCVLSVLLGFILLIWCLAIPKGCHAQVWCWLTHFGHDWYKWPSGWGRTCNRCGYEDIWR